MDVKGSMARGVLRATLLLLALWLVPTVAMAQLAMNKSFSPAVIPPGGTSTLSILLFNNGPDEALNVSLVDDFPASPSGLTVGPGGLLSNTCGGAVAANTGDASIVLSGGAIPAASGVLPGQCEIVVEVVGMPPTAPASYLNEIPAGNVTSSVGSPGADVSASLSVIAGTEIGVSKTIINFPVRGGAESTVRITLNNLNLFDVTGVSVSDPLPGGGILVVAATPDVNSTCGGTVTATPGATSFSLAGGVIAAGSSCVIEVDIEFSGGGTDLYGARPTNTIAAGTLSSDQGISNTVASRNFYAFSGATLTKAFSPAVIAPDGDSTLTITIGNRNAIPIDNFSLTDNLPAGVTITGAPTTTCSGGTVDVVGSDVTLSGATVPGSGYQTSINANVPYDIGSASCTVTIPVTANALGTYTNTIPAGTFSGGVPHTQATDDLDVIGTEIVGYKDFTPYGGANPDIPQSGQTTLRIRATNTSTTTPATNLSITDDLATMGAGISIGGTGGATANTCGGTVTAVPGTTLISLTGGSIPPGTSAANPGECYIEVPVRVAADATRSARNNDILPGAISSDLGSNPQRIRKRMDVTYALRAAKAWLRPGSNTAGATSVNAGDIVRVRVQVLRTNQAARITDIGFTDTLPAGFVIAPTPNESTTCSGGSVAAVPGNDSFTLSGGVLGSSDFVGADNCYVYVDVVAPITTGQYINRIEIGDVTGMTNVGQVANVTAASDDINVTSGLGVSKSFSPINIAAGGTSRVSVVVSNTGFGAVALTGVNLADALPAGLEIAAVPNAIISPIAGTCGGNASAPAGGNTATWSSGSIGVNAVCELAFDVTTGAIGTFVNTIPSGAVSSTQNISNVNSALATLVSSGDADIAVTKDDGVPGVGKGDSTTYQINVTNNSTNRFVSGILFEDLEPTGMSFTAWTCTAIAGSSCDASSGTGSINTRVNLAPSGVATFTVEATVDSGYTGAQITNTATINPGSSGVVDPDLSNNTTSDTDDVYPKLTLVKSVDNTGGGTAAADAWTLQASGPTPISGQSGNAAVTDVAVLPGTYALSESGGPTDYTAGDWVCTNGIAVNAGQIDLSLGQDTVCTIVNTFQPAPAMTLVKSADVDTYSTIGQVITYTYTLTNTGNNAITGVSVSDDKLGPVTCAPTDIAPTETSTCTATYAIQASDLAATPGTITNVATGNGTPEGGTLTAPTDTVIITESVNPIVAVNDSYPGINGSDGATTGSVLDNDTLNGVVLDPADVTLTPGTAPTPANGSITMNADGTITVAPGTTAGAYTYDYTICEVLNPTNCDSATATVTVTAAPIVAEDDAYTGINGSDGATTGSVLDNDTLNGAAVVPAEVTLTPGTAPTPANGSIAMNADGTITVAPGTTAGAYTYDYTICEVLNPTNCDSATVTVTVTAAPIVAEDDAYTGINGSDGATTGSVLDNDTLNGAAVVPAEVTLTPGTAPTPANGSIAMNADGTITVAPGTTAGAYTYDYTICEVLNPTNCDSATATVTVDAAVIDAVDDTGSVSSGATGGTAVTNVLSNDSLNGAVPTLSTVTLAQVSTTHANVVLDPATGAVSVAPGTPAGSYEVVYRICEVLNPSNCDTATVTVGVAAAPINAVDDSYPGINGSDGATTGSVLINDTLNGVVLDPADVTLTPGTAPTPANGSITMNADGTITVAPGTTAGAYTYDYTICEVLNPTNCDSATATVTVDAAAIDAANDALGPVNGSDGGSAGNAYDNDTLNGSPVAPTDITGTVTTPATPINGGPVPTLDLATGEVTVPAATPAGDYTIVYQICEVLNPSNCDTATITVTVTAAPIDAVDDTFAPVDGAGGDTAGNAFDNDMLNGNPITTIDITGTVVTPATPINGGRVPILDPTTGEVTVPPATPAGDYTIVYQICEQLNPSNCDTATITVPVAATAIDAVDDTLASVNGAEGGSAGNAYSNDTLSGYPVDPDENITGTVTTPATPINGGPVPTLDVSTGEVTVPAATPAGDYTIVYQICEVLNPSNCDTATITVTVTAAPIEATDDTLGPMNGSDGGSAGNAYDNDTLNGNPVDPTEITGTVTTPATPINGGPVPTLDVSTGEVTVPAGTPAGDYTIAYQICEVLNPSNCDTATVTVTVTAAPIEANDDALDPVNGSDGGSAGNAYDNDTLNGNPVDPTEITGTVTTPATPINGGPVPTLDVSTGEVTVPAATPAGDYTIAYQICEVLNPSNCDTATVTVTVTAPEVIANPDVYDGVDGTDGGPVGNVLDNDTYNGGVTDISQVTITVDDPDTGDGVHIDPTTGAVIVDPGTPTGTYELTYTICDVINPGNCSTTTVTVGVLGDVQLRVTKTASVREVNVGDLVRYTVTVENVGDSPAVAVSIVDTAAAGLSYVDGSLSVVDGDNAGTATGSNPVRFEGLDIGVGQSATLVYLMRVGAGVRPGTLENQAQAYSSSGQPLSNVATASVTVESDPLMDDSLVFGTVFNDRDGDGWQDSAALGGVRVQGGFAPGAYVANSTTVDRGAGMQPEPDASSPMLHGIEVGGISGRASTADPVGAHQVVIRQRLKELAFTDDFMLTSAQGVTVRMDAAGQTTVERSGQAAKGLTAADPVVQRKVSQGEGGYIVDYVIGNAGIDERGIPGVRIASVEGLLVETDQFGRYHLEGIDGGNLARGRNFILKVDKATLPSGAVFSTDNPLLRRVTQGVPVRFDFGVTLPEVEIQGGSEQVELELGEVFFAPGSAEVREQYLPAIEQIAEQVQRYQGGEVVISANGYSEALAFDRANAVKDALLSRLTPELASALKVSVRNDPSDPDTMLAGIDGGSPVLGVVLFDTDKSTIKPQYQPLIDKIAAYLEQQGGGTVAVVGHTDWRASDAYNAALGMRRARAVYEAIAAKLSQDVRGKVRVEANNDPAAPAGMERK
ncbi:hypothetical protein CSC70_03640 [Pseudoxanthomonas kalamensis DSM 18571]|uniref:DUF7933 domain-containing protein n=1 Tax=Pseudoxanthomonas kalamensis TaxID=289483 RepID=UPI001390AD82|nr:OmpA family protein [Pseudoxanthomonas kalamensis]KAF1712607.1 hypothetical protein CSC70_03640 [Pseudoxanthomonas kalamensis DSM 18571]